jgi:hypothetical protein
LIFKVAKVAQAFLNGSEKRGVEKGGEEQRRVLKSGEEWKRALRFDTRPT